MILVPSRITVKTLPISPNKQNGNVRQQQLKDKKTVISPSASDSSYSPTAMDEKNNNIVSKRKSNKNEHNDFECILPTKIKKEQLIGKFHLSLIR